MRNILPLLKNMFLSKLKKQPYKIDFTITSMCDSNCLTCGIAGNFRKNPKTAEKDLSLDEITKIFGKFPKTLSYLALTGGEPFLRNDFVEIVEAAIRNLPQLNILTIATNGMNTKRITSALNRITELKLPYVYITLSLDGPKKIHDKIRGINGAYEKTMKTYSAIKKIAEQNNRINIQFQTTVSSLNAPYLPSFLKKLMEKGDKVTITLAEVSERYGTQHKEDISPKKFIKDVVKISKIVNKHLSFFNPNQAVEKLYLKKIVPYLNNPKKQIIPCVALELTAALDSDGRVYPCSVWRKSLGNLRDYNYDIMRMWNSTKAKKNRELIRKSKCPNCWTPCESYQGIFWNFFRL